METVPFFAFDTCGYGIMRPFLGDMVPSGDWDEKTISRTFKVDFVRYFASGFPSLCVSCYIFFCPITNIITKLDVRFFVVWRRALARIPFL